MSCFGTRSLAFREALWWGVMELTQPPLPLMVRDDCSRGKVLCPSGPVGVEGNLRLATALQASRHLLHVLTSFPTTEMGSVVFNSSSKTIGSWRFPRLISTCATLVLRTVQYPPVSQDWPGVACGKTCLRISGCWKPWDGTSPPHTAQDSGPRAI